MNEKERLEKKKSQKNNDFDFRDTPKGIKLVTTKILSGVRVNFNWEKFKKIKCYLYHFDKLGITERNIEEELEGAPILIYKSNLNKNFRTEGVRCRWCYAPVDNIEEHIGIHGKTMKNMQLLEFQKALYQELLRIIRDTDCYMAMPFINSSCQMCDNPIMKGRELCCSIPTSFRDRIRSLNIMGLTADSIDERYLTKSKYGQIILAPKNKTNQYIDIMRKLC